MGAARSNLREELAWQHYGFVFAGNSVFGCVAGDSVFGGADSEATFVSVIRPVPTRISKTMRAAATMAHSVTDL